MVVYTKPSLLESFYGHYGDKVEVLMVNHILPQYLLNKVGYTMIRNATQSSS